MSSNRARLICPALFWTVLGLTTLWRVLLAAGLDPCDDEAYYFCWSLQPQLSYMDHPPLVAWAMTIASAVFGDSIWTVRFWPLLLGTSVPILGRSLGRRLFGQAVADTAGLFLILAPGFAGNGLLMTPDALFVVAWAVAVFCTWQGLDAPALRPGWWLLAGVSAGMGSLSKYNMILYFAGLGLLWLLTPGRRFEIARGTVMAGFVALLFFSVVVLWNAHHDWVSFRKQLGHGFDRETLGLLRGGSEFVGGLLLVATPGLACLTVHAAAGALAAPSLAARFAAAFFWPTIVLFGASALRGNPVGPNWSMAAFFTGFLLVAARWDRWPVSIRRTTFVLLLLPLTLALAALTYIELPGPGLRVAGQPIHFARIRQFVGGQEMADVVRRRLAESKADFVWVSRCQIYSKLAFFAPDLRDRLCLLPGKIYPRFPWRDDRRWRGRDALVVRESSKEAGAERLYFDGMDDLGRETIEVKGALVRVLSFNRGTAYRPPEQRGKFPSKKQSRYHPEPRSP